MRYAVATVFSIAIVGLDVGILAMLYDLVAMVKPSWPGSVIVCCGGVLIQPLICVLLMLTWSLVAGDRK